MRLNRCLSSSKSSHVTDPIKVIKIIINYILFLLTIIGGFPRLINTAAIYSEARCLKQDLSPYVRPNCVCT